MRALFVAPSYADPVARAKLRTLAASGHTIAVVFPEGPGARADDDHGVRVIPIPTRGSAPDLLWEGRALRRAFADFAPELVQLEVEPWSRVATRVAAMARRQRAKVVQYCFETLTDPLPLLARRRRARVLRSAGAIAAAGATAADRARTLRQDVPIAVVPDLAVAAPPPALPTGRSDLALGFVGRLRPHSGVDVLLRALVHLHGDWTLTVIGTGPAQEQLEELSERLGLASHVHWLGALPSERLEAVWPAIDCLVLPARTVPGFGRTGQRIAVEAMARGIPVVAVPAFTEVIADGGMVVADGDDAELREVLQQLHDDAELRRDLGGSARRHVQLHHAPGPVAQRTVELWEAAQ